MVFQRYFQYLAEIQFDKVKILNKDVHFGKRNVQRNNRDQETSGKLQQRR